MDTKKIGAFLKQCRKEKNLTQEQLAEKFEVSARTVSRWETGINMPDLRDRKSTRLNSSHSGESRMPSSA